MYLVQLDLRELKLIRDLSWSFERDGQPRMWTVLIGRNGLCKTTILRAIAMAATGSVRANQLAEEILPSLPDRRAPSPTVQVVASFRFSERHHEARAYPGLDLRPAVPPTLVSSLHLSPGKRVLSGLSHYLDTEDRGNPLDEARSTDLPHWFVAGYGVSRSLSQPGTNGSRGDPLLDRLNPLFDKGRLIGTAFIEELEFRAEYLKTLQEILAGPAGLLPHVTDIELRGRGGVRSSSDLTERNRIVFASGDQKLSLPAFWMSHGYQATMAWVADLVGQIFLEAKAPVPAAEMEGIVLVDEIDLHLHPAWQVELIPTLKRVFPRLQFIVTTHSPMVLPGLEQEEIVVLDEDEEGNVVAREAPESPALMTGSDIYRTFFGIDKLYPAQLGADLQRYSFLVGDPLRSDGDEAEMAVLQKRLAAHGVDPGWTPVVRRERPRFPGVGGPKA